MEDAAQRSPAQVSGLVFDDFFRDEYEGLVRAIFLLSGSAEEAEDLVQDAFVRVLERWAKVEMMLDPTAYTYTVARNLLRRRRRFYRRSTSELGTAGQKTPLEGVDLRLDTLAVLQSMKLPAREVLVLGDLLGYGSRELSTLLGVNEGTARTRLSRARAAFRAEMVRRGWE